MTDEKRSYCAGCKEFDPKNPRAVCGFRCADKSSDVDWSREIKMEFIVKDPEQPELFGPQGAHP